MKPLYKIIISIVLFVVPGMALASMSSPSDLDDTIPAAPRCDKYYYTKWFDECTNYYPDGVVDSCFCMFFRFHNFYGGNSVAKWEHTKNRMKVKGLVAMVDRYTPPFAADSNPLTNISSLLSFCHIYSKRFLRNFVFQHTEGFRRIF